MTEREAFLQGIADDPRDLATRRAFADAGNGDQFAS